MGCPNTKIALELINDASHENFILMARCKKWSCPYCSSINSRNLSKLLKSALLAYLEDRKLTEPKLRYTVKLVTLTVPGKDFRLRHTVDEVEVLVKHALKSLIESMRRHYGLTEYFWVREYQKDGMAHIHLLILGPGIAGKGIMRFINDHWECQGMGRAETAIVRSVGGVAHYLCKYLSKPDQMAQDVKGSRTYAMSKELRSRVTELGSNGSSSYEVVRIYRVNSDLTLGDVLWEKDVPFDVDKMILDNNLKELMDFFSSVGGGGSGRVQLNFKGGLWDNVL